MHRKTEWSGTDRRIVYVVTGDTGPVKIGTTHDPEYRLKLLDGEREKDVVGELKLYGMVRGGFDTEMVAHALLHPQRRGMREWFDVTPHTALAAVLEAARFTAQFKIPHGGLNWLPAAERVALIRRLYREHILTPLPPEHDELAGRLLRGEVVAAPDAAFSAWAKKRGLLAVASGTLELCPRRHRRYVRTLDDALPSIQKFKQEARGHALYCNCRSENCNLNEIVEGLNQ